MVPSRLRRKGGIPIQLGQVNSQHLPQFLPWLLHLDKDMHSHCFLGSGLVVESISSLRVPNHIRDDLEVLVLGTKPFLDAIWRVSAKAEHEIPLGLQLVDGLNGLMDLGGGTYACVRLAPTSEESVSRPNHKGLGQKSYPKVLHVQKCQQRLRS